MVKILADLILEDWHTLEMWEFAILEWAQNCIPTFDYVYPANLFF
jgi:hypothetical protein